MRPTRVGGKSKAVSSRILLKCESKAMAVRCPELDESWIGFRKLRGRRKRKEGGAVCNRAVEQRI